ncbi:metabolite traffic protein EboE [Pirellulaceae bacterium SH449]
MDSAQLNGKTGYCMNVHAGRTFPEVLANLENYSARVQTLVGSPIGIGLWFSETSACEALEIANLELLRATLARRSLTPFTLNGFPQGDFHQTIVKQAVYLPTWWDTARLEYTRKLVRILDAILPDDQHGSISTLPIAWGSPGPSSEQLQVACKNLIFLAQELAALRENTGRLIVIAIEPEPGCYLTSTQTFLEFYREHLLATCPNQQAETDVLEHITLCHDVCHAAVMFEDQATELSALFEYGIKVGKVQVSSAIAVPWWKMNSEQKTDALSQLSQFAEDRYLHQTTLGRLPGGEHEAKLPILQRLVEDLPIALAGRTIGAPNANTQTIDLPLQDEWRVHFHVPIYLERFGQLLTTQPEIEKTISLLAPLAGTDRFPTGHFEIETYAWTVLPEDLKTADLAAGIAEEIKWFIAKALGQHP